MTDAHKIQPDPGTSTEHHRDGDAARPAGTPADQTPGGNDQEDVEDRPNVSQVTPEDYPSDQRATGAA